MQGQDCDFGLTLDIFDPICVLGSRYRTVPDETFLLLPCRREDMEFWQVKFDEDPKPVDQSTTANCGINQVLSFSPIREDGGEANKKHLCSVVAHERYRSNEP